MRNDASPSERVSEQMLPKCAPSRLGSLFEATTDPGAEWRPEEWGAVLRHQLTVPIEVEPDLGEAKRERANAEPSSAASPKTFAELLQCSDPPLAMLRLVKDYAKSNRDHPRSPLPRPVAMVLYFAAIAVALVRCRARITSLNDKALRHGFEWALGQDWLDDPLDPLRRVFKQALELVRSHNP